MQNNLIYFVVALPGIVINTHIMAFWKDGAVLNPVIPNI